MKKLLLACLFFSSVGAAEKTKALIWDLSGVLTHNSVFNDISSDNDTAFYILRNIEIKEEKLFDGPSTSSGQRIPYIMCAYLAGMVKPGPIHKSITAMCRKLSREDYFMNLAEEEDVAAVLHRAFNPLLRAYSQGIIPIGYELVKNLAAQYDENGTKKYRLFVLANWDPWSHGIAAEGKLRELFDCFDDIFISGEIKVIKPMREAFDVVIKKHSLQKEDCIFIDELPENVTAAKNFGITNALLFSNYENLLTDLQKLGVSYNLETAMQ